MERDEHARAYARKTVSHTLHALAIPRVADAVQPLAPSSTWRKKRRRATSNGVGEIDDDDNDENDDNNDAEELWRHATGMHDEEDGDMGQSAVVYDAAQESALDVLTTVYEACTS